jgi:hypothetical protein
MARHRLPARSRRSRCCAGRGPGDCVGLRQTIQREIAANQTKVQAHIASVAERDRSVLLAQLGTLDRVASD